MSIENPPFHTIEEETVRAPDTTWLAGAFALEGSIQFIRVSGRYYPAIFQNHTPEAVRLLQETFGGSDSQGKGNSRQWRLAGKRAADLAIPMAPFLPERRDVIHAFSEWISSVTTEQKGQIATNFHPIDELAITPEDYFDAAQQPAFCAALFDMRGKSKDYSDYKTQRKRTYKSMHINSKKRVLLDALSLVHGGSVEPKQPELIEKSIQGNVFLPKHQTFDWVLGEEDGGKFIAFIKPFLHIARTDASDFLNSLQKQDEEIHSFHKSN